MTAPAAVPYLAEPRRTPMSRLRRRLGEVLVEQRVISEQQLEDCLARQRELPPGTARRRLGAIVVDAGLATELQVATALAAALGLELVDLRLTPVNPEVVRTLPRQVAERARALLLTRHGRQAKVAVADPTNVIALDDVKMYTGVLDLEIVVAPESQVVDHLARAWSLSEDASDVSSMFDDMTPEESEQEQQPDPGREGDAPIVKLVDVVFSDAVRARASDVHVEPQADGLRIRYRVDGLLRDVMTVPKAAAASLVSRVKIVSGLDIAEKRRPQDGRARLAVDGRSHDARVSTLPTMHGEKVVVRLLPSVENVPMLKHIGMDERQLDTLLSTLVASQGLVLITGPTGSGKTNTLYAGIRQVSTPDRNIVTLEDPVEIQVPGITQVQVNERAGMTFSRGLRAVLRQDPDIVLVGEVRDNETAELALQASLTGHLVLTTLHTNDAVAAVTRLVDMGIEPFLVASSLSLVVAQRLVRRPCASCIDDYVPSPRTLAMLGLTEADLAGATPKRGRGCSDCGGTGYRGRTGVFEVLPVTAQLRAVLLSTPTEGAIKAAARAGGMLTLRASALAAARRGETTYEEALRATHVDALGGHTCPTCARGLAEDMVVCPFCATPLDTGHCSGCARGLDPEWRICPWCRTAAPTASGTPPPAPSSPARLPRLLVVDDDASVRMFVAAALDGTAEVHTVETAGEALAAVGTSAYDGVLVDNRLPDLTGVEVIRLLRADPATATVALALFTGDDSAEVEREARQAGADDYLAKPLDPLVLAERVLTLLTRRAVGVG